MWHAMPVEEVLRNLRSDAANGLPAQEAARRLVDHGENRLEEGRSRSALSILGSQFNDALIYLLLAAAVLSLVAGRLNGASNSEEAALILGIVLLNGLFGFLQDFRAEAAMQALRDLSVPVASVIRDGARIQVSATKLVPGDILVLEQGMRVAADARIVRSYSLETSESMLTGESAGVNKQPVPVPSSTALAERSSMVFMNTDVIRGRGTAVVVATAMKTEVGLIASTLNQTGERRSTFQKNIDRLGKQMMAAALVLIVAIAVLEFFFTRAGWVTTLMVAITLTVAAVPEGLPAVVTLTLAIGSHKMAKHNALVRRLSVVESLGAVDVIVSDKTGTLTENQMTVKRLLFSGKVYQVTGDGLERRGDFTLNGQIEDPAGLAPLLCCGVEVNDAELSGDGGVAKAGPPSGFGSPTEIALLISAAKAGIFQTGVRIREIPFSSERKRMTVVLAGEPPLAYMKGAPEYVLERCNRLLIGGRIEPLGDAERGRIFQHVAGFSQDALRVLAFAMKDADNSAMTDDELESGLVFIGLQAMIDPPRPEVKTAIQDCRQAGIRVIMATGDNAATAKAVGLEIGLRCDPVLSGVELDALSDAQIARSVESCDMFARVTPQHKLRLLRTLQANGHRVAMTGDGVNDAPALRAADIGVAMGQRGTEVARQASAIVLRDDNFATLTNAVAEGRVIFDNIRKFMAFLLSANAGEVLTMFFGVLAAGALFRPLFGNARDILILTPAMLLWINMVTDGLPALALAADPRMTGIMSRPPRPSSEGVINREVFASIVSIGLAITVSGLLLFFLTLFFSGDVALSQTLLFSLLVAAEMLALQSIRSHYRLGVFSNRWLVAAVASSLALQALVLYSPLGRLFAVSRVGIAGGIALLAALGVFEIIRRCFARLPWLRNTNGQD